MFIDTTPTTPAEISAAVERRTRKAKGAAIVPSQPIGGTPALRPDGHHHLDPDPYVPLRPYVASLAVTELVDEIRSLHKMRQGMIRAKNRIVLQGMAAIRELIRVPEDYDTDAAKKALRERADALYREIAKDEAHDLHVVITPYLCAAEPLEVAADAYAKRMEGLAKKLPVAAWVKSVKGLGEVSFATIVGEAGDIGKYRSVSAFWKRMGVAVIDGRRQGNPGDGATAEDWVVHGYRASRRSVSWNARSKLILGMGNWRPMFGEDVDANPDLTPYQRLYAKRARLECAKLGIEVKEAKTGKEAYSAHAANRAHRVVEKRMLKELYLNWRKASA